MKIRAIKLGLFFGVFIVPLLSFPQIGNIGTLYIGPGEQVGAVGSLNNSATGTIINDGELFVYNHLNNAGTMGFTPQSTTSMIRLNGLTDSQDLEGSGTTNLYNVAFNNDKAQYSFHLKNDVSIYGQADFQNGIVDNSNYTGKLTFENGSSISNISQNSYVSGSVIKKGNNAFVFPVGDGGYSRLASISAPNTVSDRYSAQYHFKNPDQQYPIANKGYGINKVDDKEYWQINKEAGDSPVILTLSWDSSATPDFITSDTEKISIVWWNSVKKAWDFMESTVDVAKKEVTTIAPILDYGIFTLAVVDKDAINKPKFVNGLSPNGDGINDFLQLEFLDGNPKNTVSIFNRWGARIYETSAYNTKGNVFKGIAEEPKAQKESLPAGTYFYIIDFTDEKTEAHSALSGYLYITY